MKKKITRSTTNDDGKWAQFWMKKEELNFVDNLISEASKDGLNLSQSSVIRKIMEIGWNNIDRKQLLKNPTLLYLKNT